MAAGGLVFQDSTQTCHALLEVGDCRAGHKVHIHLGHWHSQSMHTYETLQSWPLARAIPGHEQGGSEGCLLAHLPPSSGLRCCQLPELPGPCAVAKSCFKARLHVAPLLPLRTGHGAAIAKLAGQTEVSMAVSFAAGCPQAGTQWAGGRVELAWSACWG